MWNFVLRLLIRIIRLREFRANMFRCFVQRIFRQVQSRPGSSVGIATGYGLDGPRIESRWGGRDFPHLSRPALGSTQPPVPCYRAFPGGKERPGRDVDPSPLLVQCSRKSRAITLLPLWAVRPVQSFSACTRMHFTFTFTKQIKLKTMNWAKNVARTMWLKYS